MPPIQAILRNKVVGTRNKVQMQELDVACLQARKCVGGLDPQRTLSASEGAT